MIVDAHAHVFERINGIHYGGLWFKSYEYGKLRVTGALPEYIEETARRWGKEWGRDFGKINEYEYWWREFTPLMIDSGFPAELYVELMDHAGVDKAVLLQAPCYVMPNENVYLAETVRKWPDRFVAAAQIDPTLSIRGFAIRELEYAVKVLGLSALKLELTPYSGVRHWKPDFNLGDEDLIPLWEKLVELEIPVTIDWGEPILPSYDVSALREILERFPDLTVVLTHGGRFGEPKNRWKEALHLTDSYNVWIDFVVVNEDMPWFKAMYDEIGCERLMWASDLPTILNFDTYEHLIEYIRRCDFLNEKEKQLILAENALKVYFKKGR